MLISGDKVIVSDGNAFALKEAGSDTNSLRFVRDDMEIGVTRGDGCKGISKAAIRITMPAPKDVVIAGICTDAAAPAIPAAAQSPTAPVATHAPHAPAAPIAARPAQ